MPPLVAMFVGCVYRWRGVQSVECKGKVVTCFRETKIDEEERKTDEKIKSLRVILRSLV